LTLDAQRPQVLHVATTLDAGCSEDDRAAIRRQGQAGDRVADARQLTDAPVDVLEVDLHLDGCTQGGDLAHQLLGLFFAVDVLVVWVTLVWQQGNAVNLRVGLALLADVANVGAAQEYDALAVRGPVRTGIAEGI